MLKIAVLGSAGRMGGAVVRQVLAGEGFALAGALLEPGHGAVGMDAGDHLGIGHAEVVFTDLPEVALREAEVAIDFTLPDATETLLSACAATACPLVLGTTGLGAAALKALAEAGKRIPIVYERNMSIGVNVFFDLAAKAAKALGEPYDIEILEAHHRHKVDAPSGTALELGERIAKQRGGDLERLGDFARHGETRPRDAGRIGYSVIRGGNIVGEHTVMFISGDDRIELTHRAQDRGIFARGALRAAAWVVDQPPGVYGMADVLGL